MNRFWLLLCICPSLCSASQKLVRFDQMTLEERKKTGIEKLSLEERLFLEQWVNYPGKERPRGLRRAVFLSEMSIAKLTEQGKLISLGNGDVFELTPHYQKKAKEWKIGDKIRVYQSKKPFWFKFEHIPTQTIIGVKKVLQQEKKIQEKKTEPQPVNV
jgi:hypothetical protein